MNKKDDKIALLAKTKLNSMEFLIFIGLSKCAVGGSKRLSFIKEQKASRLNIKQIRN